MAVDRGAWSAEALAAKSAHLDSRDAGLASDIVFGVLRRRGELAALIAQAAQRAPEKMDDPVRLTLEIGIYQLRFLDRIPAHAAVNDAVELVRKAGKASAASFVNAVMRRMARDPGAVPETASTPPWLLQRWVRQYGEGVAHGIAHASLFPPERFIRVGEGTPPEGARATDVAGCYVLESGSPGTCRFQDIGSQAVAPLLELQPGQTFLDVCAAPGNKTAQAIETPLRAVACDVHLSRARALKALGIPIVVLDATRPLAFSAAFDRILVDAPCSGTGTLARNPEIKSRITEADILDLQRRQTAILRNALAALKPAGRLVYSTCSLEREENEGVLEAVGARPLQQMQRIPGRDRGDGFFAAVLSR